MLLQHQKSYNRFDTYYNQTIVPIDGEALALADAIEKAHYFVLGCKDLMIYTDHKPLIKIFTDRSLNDIPNPTLCNFNEKTLQNRFMMMDVPAAKHKIPDTFSRYPVSCDGANDTINDADEEASAFAFTTAYNLQAVTWDRVNIGTKGGKSMLQLLTTTQNGFPASKQDLPKDIQEHHQYRDDMCTTAGVILYKDCIVITVSLREDILNILHSTNHSVGPMLSRPMSTVVWPGITAAVQACTNRCADCHENAPKPIAPP